MGSHNGIFNGTRAAAAKRHFFTSLPAASPAMQQVSNKEATIVSSSTRGAFAQAWLRGGRSRTRSCWPWCSERTSSSARWSSSPGRVQLHTHSFVLSLGVWAAGGYQRSSRAWDWDQQGADGHRVPVCYSKSLQSHCSFSSEASMWLCGFFSPSSSFLKQASLEIICTEQAGLELTYHRST